MKNTIRMGVSLLIHKDQSALCVSQKGMKLENAFANKHQRELSLFRTASNAEDTTHGLNQYLSLYCALLFLLICRGIVLPLKSHPLGQIFAFFPSKLGKVRISNAILIHCSFR